MKVVRLLPFLFAFVLLSGCGVHTVDTGYRGLKVSFGQVEGSPLPEGLYFVNPFTTSVVQLDTRTQVWNDKSDAYTHDIQAATIHFTLNYHLDPSRVALIYRTVGEDWEAKLVGQVVAQDLKDEVAKWDAVDLVANRQRASDEAQTAIVRDLGARDVLVSGFFITDIAFSRAFDTAVEAKVIAAQQALQAQNKTAQIQQEAQQTIISAKAAAESMQIRADALEKNSKLIQWEAVQKWNGILPTYMMGNTVPFINMSPQDKN
jgi:regulator of protease activity HflC (stomatin/prohibitin superfamily)